MYQLYSIPTALNDQLESRLQLCSHSLKKPQQLAESIRKLSNLFLKGNVHLAASQSGSQADSQSSSHADSQLKRPDYWADSSHRAAYIAYFSMLNFTRAQGVFTEARRRKFLKNAKVVADWGCGGGAATWALSTEIPESHKLEFIGIDQSVKALDEYKHWTEILGIKAASKVLSLSKIQDVHADTLILSYVLNEVTKWPDIPESVERLVIIEPSTHQAGRELLEWRQSMLQNGWYAWAPCTHQKACPLLSQSGKDWCHHRIHWNKPDWFMELERFLPMRNDTLTMTYLLLSRDKPAENLEGIARVVGDEQEEKGKTRQMICRGPSREFLSWLHRDQISLKLHRGELLKIDDLVEARANEIRILASSNVYKLPNE